MTTSSPAAPAPPGEPGETLRLQGNDLQLP